MISYSELTLYSNFKPQKNNQLTWKLAHAFGCYFHDAFINQAISLQENFVEDGDYSQVELVDAPVLIDDFIFDDLAVRLFGELAAIEAV